ncbi:MAG: transposase [Patescibacteria group bacterium]
MPRINRIDVGDIIYHVINRANARIQIFDNDEDYELFQKVLEQAKGKYNMRILSYCIMPNHWHLVLYPKKDGDVGRFMQWLTLTHTQRWHAQHNTIGQGHLYQGRYKAFLIQTNEYLLQLFRYVERNALRSNIVKRAEDWKWSSLYIKERGNKEQKNILSKWPIEIPINYLKLVNEPQTAKELESLRYSVNKGKPYGKDDWTNRVIDKFKLGSTLRKAGRPKKGT